MNEPQPHIDEPPFFDGPPPDAYDGGPAHDEEEIPAAKENRWREDPRRVPHSEQAEQAVLGSILLDNEALDEVGDMLVPEDFYSKVHQVIFRTMMDMVNAGEPADPVTLTRWLEKNEELGAVGGPGYLAQLMLVVPTAAHAKFYANIVQDTAILRALARAATGIVETVYGKPKRMDTILDESEARIFAIGEKVGERRSSYFDMKTVVTDVFNKIDELFSRKESITGVPTGFHDLDRLTSGMQPSDLLIVAGRPAMGKTALAMNIAANAAILHQVPVGVFSLEMSKEQLVMRLLASESRINFTDLRTGNLKEEDYARLTTAAGSLAETPLFIDDTPSLSVMALRAKARRMKREKKIGMIVVDYLQLMTSSGQAENRVNEISEISRGLKAIAKELSVPVIALSQLSRAPEQRPDKRPMLSDLRESGSIEQDADVVMFVFREEYYKREDESLKGLAELIIAKQRNGPTGTVQLTFLHPYTRFENQAYQEM